MAGEDLTLRSGARPFNAAGNGQAIGDSRQVPAAASQPSSASPPGGAAGGAQWPDRFAKAPFKAAGKRKKSRTPSREEFAKDLFRGAKASAEGRWVPSVSEGLAGVPSAEHGKALAEMLRGGQVSASQVAAYLAGPEAKPRSAEQALRQAGSLLGSSPEPELQKAVVQGLDSIISADLCKRGDLSAAQKDSARKLEQGLRSFFDSEKLSPEAKLRTVQAVAEHSQNPALRSALAVVLGDRLGSMREHLAQDRRNLEASFDPRNLRNIPGGMSNVVPYRMELERHIRRLEKELPLLPRMQEALTGLLFGKDQKVEGESERTLGKLVGYLEQHHNGHELQAAKELMRSLFDPPSAGVLDRFAEATHGITRSSSSGDAYGLGFLLEAGRQKLEVEPRAEREKELAFAGKALQVAVAGALGYFGGPLAGAAGVTGENLTNALSSALGQFGEESVGTLVDRAIQSQDRDMSLLALQNQLQPRFVDQTSWLGFKHGIQSAERRARVEP
jgi:hypothetical protein